MHYGKLTISTILLILWICAQNEVLARGGRGGGGRGGGGRSGSRGGSRSGGRSSGSIFGKKGWSMYGSKGSSYKTASSSSNSRFRSFAVGAGTGYLIGRATGPRYYYAPYGQAGYGHRDSDVCRAEIPISQFKKSTDSGQPMMDVTNGKVTVYFLCDGSCCGNDCCELNVGFLIFIIICSMGGFICFVCCCYYGCKSESGKDFNTSMRNQLTLRRSTYNHPKPFTDVVATEPVENQTYGASSSGIQLGFEKVNHV